MRNTQNMVDEYPNVPNGVNMVPISAELKKLTSGLSIEPTLSSDQVVI